MTSYGFFTSTARSPKPRSTRLPPKFGHLQRAVRRLNRQIRRARRVGDKLIASQLTYRRFRIIRELRAKQRQKQFLINRANFQTDPYEEYKRVLDPPLDISPQGSCTDAEEYLRREFIPQRLTPAEPVEFPSHTRLPRVTCQSSDLRLTSSLKSLWARPPAVI